MVNMDLTGLDLNLLVAFERLLESGSVSEAARALGVTQPAMSRTLQRLRDALGDPLFVRSGRGLVPTERARALQRPLEDALLAVRKVFERPGAFEPARARGELRIAIGEETQMGFAVPILEAVWKRAPGIDVRFRPLGPHSVEAARRGLIDFALAPDLSALPPGSDTVDISEFVARPLYERRFVVVSARRGGTRRWTLDSYAAALHLLVGPEASGRGFVDDLLERTGRRRRVAASLSSFTHAAHVVSRTHLVSTLPEEVVRAVRVPLVIATPPLELPRLSMQMLWHPRFTTDARHRFLRETVASAIRSRAEG